MARDEDPEVLAFLRSTPSQPISAPPQCIAWDAPRLIRQAQGTLGGELSDIEARLHAAVVAVGGGRQREYFHRNDVGLPAHTRVEESYWADKRELFPERYPSSEGWT